MRVRMPPPSDMTIEPSHFKNKLLVFSGLVGKPARFSKDDGGFFHSGRMAQNPIAKKN